MGLRSEKGFNIAEVMVAFAILSIGMAGVAAMLIQSMQSDRSSIEMRSRADDAMRLIETAKGADGSGDYTGLTSSLSGPLSGGAFYKMAITLTSALDFSSATSFLNRVEVTVGWGGADSSKSGCAGKNCDQNTPECCVHVTRFWNYLIK
jgi:Tfp pilus assembly protein PilV